MSTDPILIRHATPSDAALLAELGARTFQDTYVSEVPPESMAVYVEEAFGVSALAPELADPASTFLIAESGGIAAGYARLRSSQVPPEVGDPEAIEMQRIYVLKDWQGHKVGAALMQACMDEATARGRHTMWLGVWERNQHAIAFYERWGFEQVGAHTFQMGDDEQTDLLMRLRFP